MRDEKNLPSGMVAEETIYNALGFRSQSKQSEYIRQDALKEFGGVVVDKVLFY